MADMISALEQRGHTYASDGSIYFKISTLPGYGKLARLDHGHQERRARRHRQVRQGGRARLRAVEGDEAGEPTWDAGIGPGRPGWHIECSAMALRLLGEPPIDIHAGGVDLIFPHHENEIAQSEGATGKPFSRFWFHVEHLMIEEETGRSDKMSKSLGNVFNLKDIVEQGYRPSALRYLYLGVHYRKQLKFSWTAMAQAEEALKRLTDFLARLDTLPQGPASAAVAGKLQEARRALSRAHAADLNTAAGIGVIFDLVRALNSSMDAGELAAGDAAAIREAFASFDQVLGVLSLRARGAAPAGADRRDRAADRGAPRRPARAELRRSGSHPQGSRRLVASCSRTRPQRHEVEEEIDGATELRLQWTPRHQDPLPGPKAKAIIERDTRFVSPSYTRDYPFVIARGEGAVVEDVDGNRFLDCAAGIAVNSTGVSHPDVVKAITEQAQKFIHMSGTDFYYEPQVRLAEELASIAPIDGEVRTFFANSGTETTEAAIKLSRYYTKRQGVIAFFGAFHGRSLGSLSLTASKAIQRRGFAPFMPGVFHAPYPDPIASTGVRMPAPRSACRSSAIRSSSTSSRPTKSARSSSNRSRARAATSCRRRRSSRGCVS